MSRTAQARSELPYRMSTADRVGLWILMGIGALIAIERGVALVVRLVEITGPGPHFVHIASLSGLPAQVQLGEGAEIDVQIDSGTTTVAHLSAPESGLLVSQELLSFLTILTIVVCLTLLARNTLRSVFFQRSNTALLATAGAAALFGFSVAGFLGQMASNELISRLSVDDPAVYGVSGTPMPIFLGAFAYGIVMTAYSVGARMQREAEGLV